MIRSDNLGEYALYPANETEGATFVRNEPPEPECAPPHVLATAYELFIYGMKLSDEHRQSIRSRGLPDPWIDLAGYRTFVPTDLRESMLRVWRAYKTSMTKIPGFFTNKEQKIECAGKDGILIPVRRNDASIAALRIRLDKPFAGTKYLWFSSSGKGGPSCGAPCHVPLGEMRDDVVRVTEGEFKADVCTLRTGLLTVSVPGATNIGHLLSTLQTIGPRRVVLAWDADKNEKKEVAGRPVNHVARGLQMAALHLSQAGYEVMIEDWDASIGKGIDDVLVSAGRDAVKLLTGRHAWESIADTMRAVGYEPDEQVIARSKAPAPSQALLPAPVAASASVPASTSASDLTPDLDTGPILVDDAAATPPVSEPVQREPVEAFSGGSVDSVTPPSPPSFSLGFGRGGPRRLALGDEVELSRLLIEDLTRMGGGVMPVYSAGQFWVFIEGKWTMQSESMIRNMVSNYSGYPVEDEKKIKLLKMSNGMASGVIRFASASIEHLDFFDKAPHGVPFRNGFMRIKDNQLVFEPHSPSHRQRFLLDFDYDPSATAPTWEKFLKDVFAEAPNEQDAHDRSTLFMEAIGVSLMGIGPKYQRAFVLLGTGNNGKSTAFDLITNLFPPHIVGSVSPQEMSHDVYRGTIATKMLNLVTEIAGDELKDTTHIKAVVTGDDISAKQLYAQPFRTRCKATHIFGANKLPDTRDPSKGFFRRFLIILFDRDFKPHEVDKSMGQKLFADRAGIANLALKSLVDMIARGDYTIPESSREKALEWREDNDQCLRFVRECCTTTKSYDAQIGPIYEAYKKWSVAKGVGTLSERKFAAAVKDLGHYRHTALCRRYNLSLKEDVVKAMESSFTRYRRGMN